MSPTGDAHKLNSGYEIPFVGLGTSQIKDQETMSVAIDAALAAGYRLIDTAKFYKNEREIGNALQESLKFLQTDYLDLVLIHYPRPWFESLDDDPNNKIRRKEAYLELEKLNREGKIRSIGISNYESRHIEELKKYATIFPAVNQCEFHPHFTRNELRAYCKKENIFFQAFSSLGRQEPALINDPVVVGLAEQHKMSVNLVLLAYALVQGTGIIPKSVTPSRIHENIGVVNVKLTKDEVDKLTALNRNQNYNVCTGWKVL